MNDVAERIRSRMDELGIKQVDLINAQVASKGTISLWLSGGSTPSGSRLVNLANTLKKSEAWILTGQSDTHRRFDDNVSAEPFSYVGKAPVLSWVQAGVWTSMDNVELTENIEYLPLVPNAGRNSFYLIVRGISNSPYYSDGEYICIDPDVSFDDLQTGDMVVVRMNNEATFKAFVRSENKCFLKALNKEWSPNIMELTEGCMLIGKYVGSFKKAIKHNLD